jgi:hypothetical protein
MVFTDFTIALPLLCQGLLDHYGAGHVRAARREIMAVMGGLLEDETRNGADPAQAAGERISGTPKRLSDSKFE